MDEKKIAIDNYWEVLKKAKEIEPDLRHHVKTTMESTTIWIHKGDDVAIKVEGEDEVQAYQQAQSRLESRMRYRH